MSSILALWAGLLLGGGGAVTGISIHPTADHAEVVIAVDGDVIYRDFTLEAPNRLVLDLMGTTHDLPRDNFLGINRGGVLAVRTSQYSEDVVRVVLELEEIRPYQILRGTGYIRIAVESPGASFQPWSSVALTSEVREDRSDESARLAVASPQPQQRAPAITISFSNTPIRDVLFAFAEYSGRSIVPGSDVTGLVSADIRTQPWDIALQTILESHGLVASELETGIIRVDNIQNLSVREQIEPLVTQTYRVNFATATELQLPVSALLSERGRVSVSEANNTLVVTDLPRVVASVADLVDELDIETPQVSIAAKIIFVQRTDLLEFGVTYDLKDSQGNQLNSVTPGAADLDGNGQIDLPEEQVPIGTDVVSLGGNSIAALGNARNRVPNPTLTLLTSLLVGRHTLIGFIEALEAVNLSDIQAAPSLTVMDNQQARILVGERTPIRVIDQGTSVVGGGGGGGGGGQAATVPQATVQIEETGIILEVTPHVTAGDNILLEVRAERSAAELADSDAGVIFRTQEAESRVLVEDGETVVFAGLTVTEATENRSGIPLLMDLPILGPLFRVTRQQTIQRDLMILVTPHIVQTN
jgi:type IV pilus secretin PilQ/predicted competence protein